ncbi:hypothetical protein KPL71_021381 [Citrus sinensis]|uniref:Uncharacterized protein n=1 Tax=Citrus sinensis TaxID=2711 RepID=A0ACB8JEM0_CITSI|nr:hypothetical protein KPL71_021381 [Citrus sinensis]
MARFLLSKSSTAIATAGASSRHHHLQLSIPSSRLVPRRTQSNQPDASSDVYETSGSSSTDPLISKLEDAIHRIIVRRSAPDWLPFLPGSSYWVPPPKSQFYGVAQLVEKLANPLTPEQSLSTSTVRGWPSSDYYIKGKPLHKVEEGSTSSNESEAEDEEG